MDQPTCPAGDVLAAFSAGELTADAARTVQQHVAECDACLEVVGHLATRSMNSSQGAAAAHVLPTAGQQIGPYVLIRRVGEGGMGEVWAAQQTAPVKRLVALKLLKAGMDTRQVVARFEGELQMLALMQHPGIAQIFDAGVTDRGRPYFAMEFVNGERITDYCDQASLGLGERLVLFQRVCDAIQHAHQKGVIHRDIKPSNVLVTLRDGKTQPKVIDFGLAKVTSVDFKDASLTELGTVLGTPAYASPEQMSLGTLDVDTRSDVYSLGVVLYELLVGVIPFEMDQASHAAMVELRRTIREQDPLRPSARLARLGARANDIASERRMELHALQRQLERELDWIAMKALEKNRDRRYASPKDLAADIQRFLDNEPLVAGPPTTSYRVRKFVQRHRAGTALAAVFVGLVTAFVATTLVQSQRIARERDRAEAEAAKANSISAFLQETLSAADPWQTGADISIRETLAQAVERTSIEFKDQPLQAAAVQTAIGLAYEGLGQLEAAEPLLRAGMKTRIELLGPQHPDVAESHTALAEWHEARGEHIQAADEIAAALSIKRAAYGNRDPRVADTLTLQSAILFSKGDYALARTQAEEALAIREAAFGPESAEVAAILENLSGILGTGLGDLPAGERAALRALDIYRKLYGAEDIRAAHVAGGLSATYTLMEQLEKAHQYAAEARRILVAKLGTTHPSTVVTTENLANTLAYMNRFDESTALLQEVLAARKEKMGPDAPKVVRTMVNLAGHYMSSGRLDETRALLEQAIPRFAKAYGEDNPEYAQVLTIYGRVLFRQKEIDLAERHYRQALGILDASVGEQHRITASAHCRLGELLLVRGDYASAEKHLLSAYGTRKTQLGPDASGTRETITLLDSLHEKTGRPAFSAQLAGTAVRD